MHQGVVTKSITLVGPRGEQIHLTAADFAIFTQLGAITGLVQPNEARDGLLETTLTRPIIDEPVISSGTFASPAVVGGTFASPVVTGGTFASPTETSGTYNQPALIGGASDRIVYCSIHDRLETQIKQGGLWWTLDAPLLVKFEMHFAGVADLKTEKNIIVADNLLRFVTVGAGTAIAVDDGGGGVRSTTGATTGNSNTFSNGDQNNSVYIWLPSQRVSVHFMLRAPEAADLLATTVEAGLRDAAGTSFFGIRRTNAAVSAITQTPLGTTTTALGTAVHNTWYNVWMGFSCSGTAINFVMNNTLAASHTTHVPAADAHMTLRIHHATTNNVAKKLGINHIRIAQDHL